MKKLPRWEDLGSFVQCDLLAFATPADLPLPPAHVAEDARVGHLGEEIQALVAEHEARLREALLKALAPLELEMRVARLPTPAPISKPSVHGRKVTAIFRPSLLPVVYRKRRLEAEVFEHIVVRVYWVSTQEPDTIRDLTREDIWLREEDGSIAFAGERCFVGAIDTRVKPYPFVSIQVQR